MQHCKKKCYINNLQSKWISFYFNTFSISMIVTGIFLPTTTMTVLPHLSTPECEKESIASHLDCIKTVSSTPIGEECTAYCLTACPGFEAGSGLRGRLPVSNMLCTFLPMHFLIQLQTACVMNSLHISTSPCLMNSSCKDVRVGYIFWNISIIQYYKKHLDERFYVFHPHVAQWTGLLCCTAGESLPPFG